MLEQKNQADENKTKAKRGRRPHLITDETAQIVRECSDLGMTHRAIAERVGVSLPTLRKVYRQILSAPSVTGLFDVVSSPLPTHAAAPRHGSGGRPEFAPTQYQRDQVAILVAAKMHEKDIAASLGISVPTLVKHFFEELEVGAAQKRAAIIQAMYRKGMAGNVTAQKAYLDLTERLDPSFYPDPLPVEEKSVETPGKKILADQAASEIINKGEGTWGELLRRPH